VVSVSNSEMKTQQLNSSYEHWFELGEDSVRIDTLDRLNACLRHAEMRRVETIEELEATYTAEEIDALIDRIYNDASEQSDYERGAFWMAELFLEEGAL